MKFKKIISVLICVIILLMSTICVYASGDNFQSSGGSHSVGLKSVQGAWNYCNEFQNSKGGSLDGLSYIAHYDNGTGSWSLNFYLFKDNCILVRENASDSDYYWYVYEYDGSKMVRRNFLGSISFQANYISCYDNDFNLKNTSKNYGCAFDNATRGYEYSQGVPIASSVENALLYFQTMDAQYLENAEGFIEVPKPKNASLYLASEENSLYVYYENEDFSLSSDTITRLWGNYRYRNASGEDIVISAIPQVDVEYVARNQLKVDLSVLTEYDTGNVFIVLNNVWNDSVDSDWIGFEYRKGSNSYYIFDVVNGEASNLREIVITDYGNVNNSYTGGTVGNITTNIPSAGQGDYSFLGGLFNGFGLLGNNGLIALLAQTFSYVPKEIFVMIGAGISAGICVALIKWLFD